MTLSLKEIQKPIAADLKTFESYFKKAMKSKVALVDRIMYYIVQRKGKQVRPMFVLFASKMCGGISEKTHIGASLIELLHTATLVHDDVVDDANKRRGMFSINALWKNKIAVLVGDYLLSQGLLLSLEHKGYDLLHITSKAVREMSEGELLQIEKARRLNLNEDIYFDIIRKKTATLIASSLATGAAATNASQQEVDQMWAIGEKLGIAFQIKDDLFDFGDSDVGKPRGIDIKEKKMTLPIIYALNKAKKPDRRRIIRTIKKDHDNKEKVREVIDFVWQSGGIEYAREKMMEYHDQAQEMLVSFPDGEGKEGLKQLIRFTVDRKK